MPRRSSLGRPSCVANLLRVNVTERGSEPHHINAVAPAMLVPIAFHIASHLGSRQQIDDAAGKIQPWAPTIRAALSELSDLDDMTLVEVSEPDDHVSVEKVGGEIVIDVDDKDASVHVSAPIRAISSAIRQIADAADATADPADSANRPNH